MLSAYWIFQSNLFFFAHLLGNYENFIIIYQSVLFLWYAKENRISGWFYFIISKIEKENKVWEKSLT